MKAQYRFQFALLNLALLSGFVPAVGSAEIAPVVAAEVKKAQIQVDDDRSDSQWRDDMAKGSDAEKTNDLPTAEQEFRAALSRAHTLSPNSEMEQQSSDELSKTLYKEGRFTDAENYLEDSVSGWSKLFKQAKHEPPAQQRDLERNVASDTHLLAETYRALHRYKQCVHAYQKLLKYYGQLHASDIDIASIKSELGDVLKAEGFFQAAENQYKSAIVVFEKEQAHDLLLDLLLDYEGVLRTTNRIQEAQKVELRIKELQAKALE